MERVNKKINLKLASPVGAGLVSANNKTNCNSNKITANIVGVGALGDPHIKETTQNKKSSKAYPNLISNLQPLITDNRGITLIALIITTIFSYDENIKSGNNKGFLLKTI